METSCNVEDLISLRKISDMRHEAADRLIMELTKLIEEMEKKSEVQEKLITNLQAQLDNKWWWPWRRV